MVRASRVVIDSLKVTGGQDGIRVVGGSNVEIVNSNIQYTTQDGISATGTSALNINNTNVQYNARVGISLSQSTATITGGQVSFNANEGMRVMARSSVIAATVAIKSNGAAGVGLGNSYARFDGSTISGNGTNASLVGHGFNASDSSVQFFRGYITNNSGRGIVAAGGFFGLILSEVTGNGVHGVSLVLGAIGNISGGTISGNNVFGLSLEMFSGAQMGGTTVLNNGNHGIWLSRASKLSLAPAAKVTVGGNLGYGVACEDAESSLADLSQLIFSPSTGMDLSAGCTGY